MKAAKLLAVEDLTQEQVAKQCNVTRQTVNVWFQRPEFHEKVSEYILADERATKAGILKRALNTLDKKSLLSESDKTTELEYLKFIADLMGLTDQKAGVNIFNTVGVVNSPIVKEAARELCDKIREVQDATFT